MEAKKLLGKFVSTSQVLENKLNVFHEDSLNVNPKHITKSDCTVYKLVLVTIEHFRTFALLYPVQTRTVGRQIINEHLSLKNVASMFPREKKCRYQRCFVLMSPKTLLSFSCKTSLLCLASLPGPRLCHNSRDACISTIT